MNKQELLQKYLNEECSTEELCLLYHYLRKDDVEEYLEIMYIIWKELELNTVQSMDEATFGRIYEKIMATVKKDNENK